MRRTRFTWIDRLLGLSLTAALAMAAPTALSPPVQAAERVNGSGQTSRQQRAVGEFQGLQVAGQINVVLRQGSAPAATVTVDDNLQALLETVVEAGQDGPTLVIRWKRGVTVSSRSSAQVDVTATRLSHLSSSGSGTLTVEAFKAGPLTAAVAGSGDLRFNGLQAETLSVAIAGSGSLAASGQTGSLSLRMAGSGNANTEALKADDVRISMAGSGDAAVQANRRLEVSVAGSGDVVYSGNATVKSSVAGSGSVRKR
jgi:hypothetical protein